MRVLFLFHMLRRLRHITSKRLVGPMEEHVLSAGKVMLSGAVALLYTVISSSCTYKSCQQ